MKKITLLIIVFFSVGFLKAQCPTENIVLTTQTEIDNFSITYPNCTQLDYELKIDGTNNSINNLNGLSEITHAHNLLVTSTAINDLYGLDNLVEVAYLTLWFNNNIQDLEGLNSLQNALGLELFINNNLINLSGLNSIQSIDNINFFANSSLDNISQLSFLTSIESLELRSNALSSLIGLDNLHTVENDFIIADEPLENFNDFSNLKNIGGSLYLMNNTNAQDISAFSNIHSVYDLYIIDCPNLENLTGLQNIQVVENSLRIGLNSSLLDLTVFSKITSVNKLDIYNNENLISLRGLENLDEIQDRLLINNNPDLIAIEQLRNVNPTLVQEVVILDNMSLSICNNEFICAIIDDDTVDKTIALNNTGCNSVEEVLASCLLGLEDVYIEEQIVIYPNPVSHQLILNYPDAFELKNVSVFNLLGQKLYNSNENMIDFSSYSNGIYFVKIETNQGTISKKIIKE